MLKKYSIPLWSIILMLVGFIGTTVLYAWDKDTSHLEDKIDTSEIKILNIESTYATKEYVKDKLVDYNKIQAAENKTLNARLDGLEKSTNNTEKMVQKLLDIELKNK